jgi:glyceraldehyde 3-phosphate dehydrogenase
VVDLVVDLARPASRDEINNALKEASQGYLKGIVDYCELPLVSIDFKGSPYSAIIDALSTMVIEGNMAKVIAWYDNEWGYSQRVLDLVAFIANKGF